MELIEAIAKTCHAVHNVSCKENGQHIISWEDKTRAHKEMVFIVIHKILIGLITTPEEAHQRFIESKEADGWIYGEIYSTEHKTSPRLVEFRKLAKKDRIKDEYFFAIVNSFKGLV